MGGPTEDDGDTRDLTLTAAEYDQLAALVDATVDGRVVDVRLSDVSNSASRYRARYLRATRVADGGLDDDDS